MRVKQATKFIRPALVISLLPAYISYKLFVSAYETSKHVSWWVVTHHPLFVISKKIFFFFKKEEEKEGFLSDVALLKSNGFNIEEINVKAEQGDLTNYNFEERARAMSGRALSFSSDASVSFHEITGMNIATETVYKELLSVQMASPSPAIIANSSVSRVFNGDWEGNINVYCMTRESKPDIWKRCENLRYFNVSTIAARVVHSKNIERRKSRRKGYGYYDLQLGDAKGSFLIGAVQNGNVDILNLQSNCKISFKAHEREVFSVALSSREEVLASGGRDMKIKIWDLCTKQLVKSYAEASDAVYTTSFAKNPMLANILASSGFDRTLRLNDIRTRRRVLEHTISRDDVLSLDFATSGYGLVTGSQDQMTKVFDLRYFKDGNAVFEYRSSSPVKCVRFSPNSTKLALAGQNGKCYVLTTQTNDIVSIDAHEKPCLSLYWIDQNTLVSSGMDSCWKMFERPSRLQFRLN